MHMRKKEIALVHNKIYLVLRLQIKLLKFGNAQRSQLSLSPQKMWFILYSNVNDDYGCLSMPVFIIGRAEIYACVLYVSPLLYMV